MIITVLGLIGAGLCVFAYMLLSLERMNPKGTKYFTLNAVGSLFLLIAISADYDGGDAGGIIMEVAWALISIYGIMKILKKKKHERAG